MPGMMDTILNLGLNDDAVEGLAASTGNPRFAYDSYRRLIQMYGEVVDGRRRAPLRAGAHRPEGASAASQQDVELDADDLRELVGTFKRIYEEETGTPSRRTRASSSREPCAPSSTRGTRRARRSTGARTGIPDDLGTAVNVVADGLRQQGRAARRPASRSRATRRPASRRLYGEFLAQRAGRGRRRRHPHARADRAQMDEQLPEAFARAASTTMRRLEEHYRDMQDIEFTVEDGHALPAADAHRQADGRGRAARPPSTWSTRA